ncbi:hypothetical protein [Limnofasciculus baicalensis]|uniref:Uncharacterized protein n=1 Tax=Limnofasciculus baicalensis BBK-W-15 TaxID=2699891 RepID=A0AAE3GUG1_9CYAN|nr:hypothetical protein [Limnofasciculus baicalensis]MCP2730088.1 hypothetical protein [Limnofasciculus baicalensis BBK-W-15]
MDSKQRLANLEKILNLHYETLDAARKRCAVANDIFEKNAINQRIREEVLPEIRQAQTNYWNFLETQTSSLMEVDAHNAIVEVVPEVELIVNNSSAKYPEELMQKLHEILKKLNEPQTPAAAKLKAALPLIPGIVSYEVEFDTENSLTRVFERIKQLFKKPIDEKKTQT